MLHLIEQIGADRIMFSTDYPHWGPGRPALRLQGEAAGGLVRG
jgi:predicted TIM-barrel fold metal-dependent hydrolase